MSDSEKKTWVTPELTQYGKAEDITRWSCPKHKVWGCGDDWVQRISCA